MSSEVQTSSQSQIINCPWCNGRIMKWDVRSANGDMVCPSCFREWNDSHCGICHMHVSEVEGQILSIIWMRAPDKTYYALNACEECKSKEVSKMARAIPKKSVEKSDPVQEIKPAIVSQAEEIVNGIDIQIQKEVDLEGIEKPFLINTPQFSDACVKQLFRLICWAEEYGMKEALEVLDSLFRLPKTLTDKKGHTRDYHRGRYEQWVENQAIEKKAAQENKNKINGNGKLH